jgi:hypothetical protein
MFPERDTDLIKVKVDDYFMQLLEEFIRTRAGDRDGKVYVQEGRQPDQDSGEVRDNIRLAGGG